MALGARNGKVRVLLADDHEAVLRAAAALLKSKFEVVGSASDGQSLVESALHLKPDVVVVDISMPGCTGIEAIKALKAAGLVTKVVFLTVHDDPDFARAALALGTAGYVVKRRMASDLIPAIQLALAGRSFVSPPIAAQL